MKRPFDSLLDASAILALIGQERGADDVLRHTGQRAGVLTVQWAEVAAILAEVGSDPRSIESNLRDAGLGPDDVRVIEFTQRMATLYGRVRAALEPHVNVGFADYAALAGALALELPLITSDSKLSWVNVGVEVVHFRPWERIPRPASVPAGISLR